jgi:hypothetical protein
MAQQEGHVSTGESWLNRWVMAQQVGHGLAGGLWLSRWVMAQQVILASIGVTAPQVGHTSAGGSHPCKRVASAMRDGN